MAHRRMIIRERLTAIIGSAILFALVATSYWYSNQTQVAGLKYVPSDKPTKDGATTVLRPSISPVMCSCTADNIKTSRR